MEMGPQQVVIAATGFAGAFFWAALSIGALFEKSPQKAARVVTGLCLTTTCLIYGGVFSAI